MKAKRTSARPKRTAGKRAVATQTRPVRRRATAAVTTQQRRAPAQRATATRKAAPRRRPVALPPILLEGDQPAWPAVSGPGEKFALGPTPPEAPLAPASAELPEAYGTKRLYLTARDPHWLYANWDLTREQQARYNRQSADGHLRLRIYADTVGGRPLLEIHVHPESRHWFVPLGGIARAGVKYAAELGFYRKRRAATGAQQWTRIAASAPLRGITPPEMNAADAPVEFATIPVDVPFEKLLALVARAVREHRPLAQAVEALRQAGHSELPPVAAVPTAPWTPEQERALAEIVNLDQVRRVWIGSLEVTELIGRELAREVLAPGLPTSPAGGVSSLASPFGGEQPRGKGFWFNVNAELIIYGATEPDASVSIGGRKIGLRPDGSFTCRFSFPDGQYELPVVAVSADDTDGRAAEMKFSRGTVYWGEVGAHPQDAALKPPAPDNA